MLRPVYTSRRTDDLPGSSRWPFVNSPRPDICSVHVAASLHVHVVEVVG